MTITYRERTREEAMRDGTLEIRDVQWEKMIAKELSAMKKALARAQRAATELERLIGREEGANLSQAS